MRNWLVSLALDDEDVADLVLAVDEAAANAVEHAYHPDAPGSVEVLLWTEPTTLCIEVVDHGTWRPPDMAESFRGRGIQVMRRVADSMVIHYDTRGTRVLLRRALSGHALPPP